jgi:putative transposase
MTRFSSKMIRVAPQEIRTFFITSVANGRRPILRADPMARLLIDLLQDNRAKGRFLLHEFVIMPDHFHSILTPAGDVSLEKAVQYIKGGFSFRAKRELRYPFLIWQESFTDHRIRDDEDYQAVKKPPKS